ENGLMPREATIAAMNQVSGPVIAVGLVLSAVFVPCAFISGITGQFFRQFALTIAVSTIISAFNSLTLSPALTAILLRPRDKHNEPPLPRLAFPLIFGWLAWEFLGPRLVSTWLRLPGMSLDKAEWVGPISAALVAAGAGWFLSRPVNWLLVRFFRVFNRGFTGAIHGYVRAVGGMLRVSALVLLVYVGLLGLTYWEFTTTRRGLIPQQDMGYLMMNVQLPDSASKERTLEVMRQIEDIAARTKGIKHLTTIAGQSFVLNAAGSNFGSCFVNLKDYADRRDPSLSADAIAARIRQQCEKEIPDAIVLVFPPPPVRGVGRAGGFALMIEDRGDFGPQELQAQTENIFRKGNQTPGLVCLPPVFRANVPMYHIDPDPGACALR